MKVEQNPISISLHQSSACMGLFPSLNKDSTTVFSVKIRNFSLGNGWNLHRGRESDYWEQKMCIQQLWVRKSVPADQNHIAWIVRQTLEHFFSRYKTVPNSSPKLHWNWRLFVATLVASATVDVLQDYDNQNKSKNSVFLSWYGSVINNPNSINLPSPHS